MRFREWECTLSLVRHQYDEETDFWSQTDTKWAHDENGVVSTEKLAAILSQMGA